MMKKYRLSLDPTAFCLSPLSKPKGKAWSPFTRACGRAWAGCALAAALLLTSGCALEDPASQSPEPAAPTASAGSLSGIDSPSDTPTSAPGPVSQPETEPPASSTAGIICDIPEEKEPDWDKLLYYEKGEAAAHIEVRPEWDVLSADDSKMMIWLYNRGDKGLLYTPSYRLERQTGTGWESLAFRPDAAVPSEVYYLRPGAGSGKAYRLADLAEPARPGVYRITIGGEDLGLSCTFTLRESENLGPRIDQAAAYGDQILERENGRLAVIPEQRRYPVGVQSIRAVYANDSDEEYCFGPISKDYVLEKKQPDGQWTRVQPEGEVSIESIAASVQSHSSRTKEFDLSILPQDQLTAGEYRVLEGIIGDLYPPVFIFHFSLTDEAV